MVFAVNFTVFAPTRTTPAFTAAALARTNRTNNTAFLIGPSSILRFTIVKKGLQCRTFGAHVSYLVMSLNIAVRLRFVELPVIVIVVGSWRCARTCRDTARHA